MNISNHEVERNSMEAEYGEEVMYAGWNPAVVLVCQQQLPMPTDRQMNLLADLVTAELFLKKMYACQR